MKNDFINIIYAFQETPESTGQYYIQYAYNDEGHIGFFQEKTNKVFDSKEELVGRVEDFLGTNDFDRAQLISIKDFNIGLESCNDQENFHRVFQTHGIEVFKRENDAKKSLFGKIF